MKSFLSFLTFLLFLLHSSYANRELQLGRPCDTQFFCEFDNEKVNDRLYFSCSKSSTGVNTCDCHSEYVLADSETWDVGWNRNGKCSVGKGGPCGLDNGIEIVCDDGFECIQGRCRDSVGKGKELDICHEKIDCQPGLECKSPQQFGLYIRKCVPPGYKFPKRPGPRPRVG